MNKNKFIHDFLNFYAVQHISPNGKYLNSYNIKTSRFTSLYGIKNNKIVVIDIWFNNIQLSPLDNSHSLKSSLVSARIFSKVIFSNEKNINNIIHIIEKYADIIDPVTIINTTLNEPKEYHSMLIDCIDPNNFYYAYLSLKNPSIIDTLKLEVKYSY